MEKANKGILVRGVEADSLEGLILRIKWLEADVAKLKGLPNFEHRFGPQKQWTPEEAAIVAAEQKQSQDPY